VRVVVGADIQQVVDAEPPGSTFLISAGTHRLQEVVPRDGDVFIGEDGAVLNGARDISHGVVDWTSEGDHWFVGDQAQEGEVRGHVVDGGRDRDRHPEDLFVDDVRYAHVADRSALGPGRFHFDYDADRIYLAEDPRELGHIETSVATAAFSGEGVTDVVLDNLVVERYASPAQRGAVGGVSTRGWTLRRMTVRDNHGGGVRTGPGMTIEGSAITGNGQIGIVGGGVDPQDGYAAPLTIRDNEIAGNLVLDYDPTWEGGGTKFVEADAGILVEGNWVHDNLGHGLWFDLGVYSADVRANLVESNELIGIFYEISHGPHPELGGAATVIHANEVRDNGHGADDIRRGSGIYISNSEAVEVRDNHLAGNRGGILVRHASGREVDTARVRVHDNDLSYEAGCTGLLIDANLSRAARRTIEEAVTFAGNRYGPVPETPFCWGADHAVSADAWADLGHEPATEAPADTAPPDTAALASRPYGARS
jgi:hypothetical protein